MKQSELFVKAISVLMAVLIPIILYGFNFNSIAFNRELYKEEFSKHNVYDNLKNYDIEKINDGVLNYLKNGKNNNLIENDFFNEREKRHLLDVKRLVQGVLSIFYFSTTLFLLLIITLFLLMNFNFELILKKLSVLIPTNRFFIVAKGDSVQSIIQAKFPEFYANKRFAHGKQWSIFSSFQNNN